MARSRGERAHSIGGLRDSGNEALQLVVDYVKQETLEPLQGLGRYVLFGVAGSVAIAVGLVVLTVGLLRLLQGETGTAFAGNQSWVPYVICAVAVVAVAALAVWAIARARRRPRAERRTS